MSTSHSAYDVRALLVAACLLTAGALTVAGPLDPPAGQVAPTFKTLAEVEPRIAISAATTPGDNDSTPSLFRITHPGSYYLTGDIFSPGRTAIEVVASNVTIDLCGFSITGNQQGNHCGITQAAPSIRSVRVRNGTIALFGGAGIDLHDITPAVRVVTGAVEGIIARNNGGVGIAVGDAFEVRDCIAESNGGTGFLLGDCGMVSSCMARENTGAGFNFGGAGSATGCTAVGNSVGFASLSMGSYRDCTAQSSTGDGFSLGAGSTVVNCTAAENSDDGFLVVAGTITSCSAQGNTGDGFTLQGGCVLTRSTSRGNTGAGVMFATGLNRVEDNHVISNGVPLDYNSTASNAVFRNTFLNNGGSYQSFNSSVNSAGETRVTQGTVGLSSSPWMNFLY